MSLLSRKKISEHNIKTGKRPPSRAGISVSELQRKKISKTMKLRGYLPPSALGKMRSDEFKKRVSLNHSRYWLGRKGKDHSGWRGGITPLNKLIRGSTEYKVWRNKVFQRDNFTCQKCGKHGGKLNADHIKPFAYYPELRFELSNGRTLCISCHKSTETFGRKAKFELHEKTN